MKTFLVKFTGSNEWIPMHAVSAADLSDQLRSQNKSGIIKSPEHMEVTVKNGFQGTFLSNFWPVEITYQGLVYPSVENFYQAMKTRDKTKRQIFTKITAADAKKRGQSLIFQENWENLKIVVMTYGIRAKFVAGSDLAEQLLLTGNAELVEYNYWHDNFWGDCTCATCSKTEGQNNLGKIIMQVRNELQKNKTAMPNSVGPNPLKEETMNTTPAKMTALVKLDKLTPEEVAEITALLEKNILPHLQSDVSNYAKGRQRVWLPYEAPLGNQPFTPGLMDGEVWQWIVDRCAKYGFKAQVALISKGGNIKPHGDTTYAAPWAMGFNLGVCNWHIQNDRDAKRTPARPTEADLNAFYSSKTTTHLSLKGGEVFKFNCKHEHAVTEAAPDRWSINVWAIADGPAATSANISGRLTKMLEDNPQVAEFIDLHQPGADSNISRKENNMETPTNNPKEGTTMSDKPIYAVAFTGHRPHKLGGYDPTNPKRRAVVEAINEALKRAVEKFGPTHQIVAITGGALGVDQDAASVAHKLGIPFVVAVPCQNQDSKWPADAKARYAKMIEAAQQVIMVHDGPYNNTCMQKRNEWMVDHCDALIAVWDGSSGGTANCVNYAKKVNKPVIRINPDDFNGGGGSPTPTPNNPKEGPTMKAEQPQNNNPVIETDNGKETKVSKKPISVDKWTTDIGLSVELKRSDNEYLKETGSSWFAVVEGKPVYPKKEDGVIDELTARLWLNRKGLATMPEIKTPEVKPTEKKEVKMTTHINPNAKRITLPNGVTLNEQQSEAYDAIVNGSGNMLLTGNAGTGKSFVLHQAIEAMRNDGRSVVVTATTGIAATHIGGKTYHSALRMFPNQDVDMTVRSMASNHMWVKAMRHVELIIIDEVSMMHKNEFIRLDAAFRRVFDSTKPFGGKRLCLVGDFLQVEPVEKNKKGECNFVFMSKAWSDGSFVVHQLTEVVRQQDSVDAGFLNNVRRGIVSKKMKPIVEQIMTKVKPESGVVHLVPTNQQADSINKARLDALPGDAQVYTAVDRNPKRWNNNVRAMVEDTEFWDKNTLVPKTLVLKPGATVINLLNDWDRGLVNGDVGVVEELNEHGVMVNFNRLGRMWMQYKKFHQGNEMVEYRLQIPLKTAWAITIHKSQGMTLDSVIVSSASVFADGQCYVALSRVRSLAGLYLDSFDFHVISANEQALDFYGLSGNLRGPAAEAECSIPDENDNDDPNGGGGINPMNPAPNNNDGGPELIVPTHEEEIMDTTPINNEVIEEVTETVEPQQFAKVDKSAEATDKTPKEGSNMIKEYFIEYTVRPDENNIKFRSTGRIITNDPEHWFKNDEVVVIEEINRGGYHYALLEHIFGATSFAVNITAFKNPISPVGEPQLTHVHHKSVPTDVIFGWADFDSETIFRVKGHGKKGWSDMSEFGLSIANSEKMTKRLVELVRAARGYKINKAGDKFLRILVLTHEQILKAFPHLQDEFNAEKTADGISVMAVEKAKDVYKNNVHMKRSGINKILKQMDELHITNHTLRVLTNINGVAGEIKGNVLTGKRANINARLVELGLSDGKISYDIVTSVDNFKKELGTDGSWEIITLEPHHGPGMVKTNDQTMAQFWGIKGIFDAEELLEAFQTVVDDMKNRIFQGQDIEWTTMLRGERAVTEAEKISQITNKLNSGLNHMYATLNDLELPLGVSQTLMYMRARSIKKMFLSQTRNGDANWTAPAKEKKSFVYMPWAYRAYVMTKEMIYLAGYDIDMTDDACFYHEETQTFAMPGKLWAEVCGKLGGADLDDEIMVHVRKLIELDGSSRLVAMLIRTPNDWAEYAIVDIDDFGPVFVNQLELPVINAKDLVKFQQTSICGQLPSKINGSNRPKPQVWDWASSRYNYQVAKHNNGGVGNQVKTKMLQYAINNAPFNNLPCANEDMIDAIQQCKGDTDDMITLSEWSTDMVAALLQGQAMDAYWWYSRNMYSTAKALKINNFTRALRPEQSPIVRDLMLPREEMINEAFEEIFKFLKKSIVEIEEISAIGFKNKDHEMKIRKLIKEQRIAFDVYGMDMVGRNTTLNKAATEILNRMIAFKANNGEEAGYMHILRMARLSYVMKTEMPNSNWDKWLYTVAPNSDIQMIDFLYEAMIWYRKKNA